MRENINPKNNHFLEEKLISSIYETRGRSNYTQFVRPFEHKSVPIESFHYDAF